MEKSDKTKAWIGNITIFLGFLVACIIVALQPTFVGLSVLGIVIFAASLLGGNILSKDNALTTGEVRRAIAIASTVVFFGLFFLESIPQELKPLIDNFWKVYGIIIGFYFGTRAAEEINKYRADKREVVKISKKNENKEPVDVVGASNEEKDRGLKKFIILIQEKENEHIVKTWDYGTEAFEKDVRQFIEEKIKKKPWYLQILVRTISSFIGEALSEAIDYVIKERTKKPSNEDKGGNE